MHEPYAAPPELPSPMSVPRSRRWTGSAITMLVFIVAGIILGVAWASLGPLVVSEGAERIASFQAILLWAFVGAGILSAIWRKPWRGAEPLDYIALMILTTVAAALAWSVGIVLVISGTFGDPTLLPIQVAPPEEPLLLVLIRRMAHSVVLVWPLVASVTSFVGILIASFSTPSDGREVSVEQGREVLRDEFHI